MLGKQSKIRSALLIGGEPMPKQLQQIRSRPRLIVGTPGRINDHLKRGNLMLHDTDFLVLDETDRMLDMGFTIQIENVMKYMPAKRQTLLFSATIPKNIARIAAKYLNNPVHVAVNTTSAPAANIKQDILRIKEVEKYPSLLTQLNERKGSIIIFVKTKYGTEKMAARLSSEGHSADAIHGDLRQNKRDRVIAAFRKKKYRILVATDVAARGLDIPHIEHVINYDLPQCAEDYIHRIGRTARAGARGAALNLVTPADKGKWRAIDRLLNPVSSN
jgi:superfamily II DNA/RNA helicase